MIINVNKCNSKRVSTEHENENDNENSTLLSCNNITEYYLNVNLSIKNKKSYEKISTNDFVIPAYIERSEAISDCFLLKEIKNSEVNFIEFLKVLKDFFITPLRTYFCHLSIAEYRKKENADAPLILHSKREKYHPHLFPMFDVIEQLIFAHIALQNALKCESFENLNEFDYSKKLTRVLSIYFPALGLLYAQFTKHINILIESQGKIINENTDMANYIKRLELHSECKGQTFLQMLNVVKQRLSEYLQLAESFAETDKIASEILVQFASAAQIRADQESEKWLKELEMVDLSKKFKNSSILKVGRFLLHEGPVQIQTYKNDDEEGEAKNLYLYVLSDLLVICQVNAIG